MDPWSQRVNNSPAIAEARAVAALVDELNTLEHTQDMQQYLDRIDLVISLTLMRLRDADSRLVNEAALTNLHASLANIHSYLDSWAAGSGPEFLTSHAQDMCDSLLTTLASMPQQDLPVAKEALTSFKRSVNGYRLALDKEVVSLKNKNEAIRLQFETEANEAIGLISSVNDKANKVDEKVDKISVSTQDLLATQQASFSKAETERGEAFNKALTESRNDLHATLESLEEETRLSAEALKQEVNKHKLAAEKDKARVEEILGIVSEEALIGQYSKSADRELGAADAWRLVAVSSIAVAIVFAGWLAYSAAQSVTELKEIIARGILTFSFGALATYAARQSSEHRRAQRDAEQMALQLAALKPYLEDIEDNAKRDELLAQIAEKLFGQRVTNEKHSKLAPSKEDPTMVGQLLAVVLELVKGSGK